MNSEKLAFYKWIYKWVSSTNISTEGGPVDTPQIAAVLQAMGYKLETVDHIVPDAKSKSLDTTEIQVKCNKSGMRAILSKDIDNCVCPSSEKANDSHFWTISGTGPSCSQDNINQIEETYSNLIPALSKEKTLLVRDILTKLFAVVSNSDLNQNARENKSSSNIWSRQRSCSDLNRSSRPTLKRQDTWETSSPITSSSPVPNRSRSVSQMSLNGDKEQMLADILLDVKENLEKALFLLPNKNDSTFTKLNEEQSNIEIKDASFTRLEINKSISEILNKTPRKNQSQDKENMPAPKIKEKKQIIVPSKFGTFTKKMDNHTPRKNSLPFVKRDTPLPMSRKLTAPVSPNISDRRLSLGAYGRPGTRPNLNLSGCSPSSIKPRTNISSGSPRMGTSTPVKKFK